MKIEVSDRGIINQIDSLIKEAKIKFSLTETVEFRHSHSHDYNFGEWNLNGMEIIGYFHEDKLVEVISNDEKFDEAAIYIANELEKNISIKMVRMSLHNPEKAKTLQQSLSKTYAKPIQRESKELIKEGDVDQSNITRARKD